MYGGHHACLNLGSVRNSPGKMDEHQAELAASILWAWMSVTHKSDRRTHLPKNLGAGKELVDHLIQIPDSSKF